MLDANVTTQLQGHLEKLVFPIELAASLDDSGKSAELNELLHEIAALSPQISVVRADDDDVENVVRDRIGLAADSRRGGTIRCSHFSAS